ncbi:MoaD/ThiS family protein [Natrialba hulunbeirensis]|uniref:MoaD/ThiS family protein n=1 Tax=Natrialba hulunbeirensis TaxID=123783 RepID=UPI00373AE9B4
MAATVAYKTSHEKHSHIVQLECVFFGPFRDAIDEKTVYHETDATTVGDLLRELEDEYPPLAGELVDEDAATLAGDTVVTLDKKNVTHIDGLATELREDAVIRLVPSVYGG